MKKPWLSFPHSKAHPNKNTRKCEKSQQDLEVVGMELQVIDLECSLFLSCPWVGGILKSYIKI